MDAIQFLKQEHRKAKAAFAKVLAAEPARRGELWRELQPELKAHEKMERTYLYGPLSQERSVDTMDTMLREWVTDLHQEEVDEVERLIAKTERLDPEDDGWLSTVQLIHTALENHISQEEGEIFPRIGEVWDRAKIAKAGEEMSGMKAHEAGRR